MKQAIKKPNIYLASPFFSPEQVDRVQRVENALEDNPFIAEYFSPMRQQMDMFPFGSKQWREAVFANDIHNLEWADIIVAVHDFEEHHVDSGTAFEIGYAYAKGKPVILVHEKDTKVNLMLSDSLHAYVVKAEDIADYNFLKMPKSNFTGEVI
jgi:nucleoside 2-deoxyribosyltransferase